ncbi:MAG: chemotaxis response regulator protein-glutamate methylesterase [Betaproteobacteria bacterium HGW-Betaproteobacteria-3]|jgi:two-component system chemotaxis response regulator CheB|nr:MAG: chemotaxis response regulator protein-glutamate methylesterase [Betaproteobacteria bacterium HGW-Betaproteobacteria-3]
MKTRVLVVDDSALVRSVMTEIINRTSDLEVVGTAGDPYIAREMIRNLNPDVLTLDVEMPRMDGLEFLDKLMRLRPMPVVMVSTLTERGAEVTMRALELGAVDFVAKPKLGLKDGLDEAAREIADKIRAAARARVTRRGGTSALAGGDRLPVEPRSGAMARTDTGSGGITKPPHVPMTRSSTEKLIAIGASTGGTEAIKDVLIKLPGDSPAVVITQHMPAGFTTSFAARLDGLCKIHVKEATDGERVLPGHAYIAPGGVHLRIDRSGANYIARLDDSEPVNRHKPSVDVLFHSVAVNVGPNAVGVMLTGMGKDGTVAMREMRDAGARNIAQDEASCVVFGMPREAIAAGAVEEILPLQDIARRVLELVRGSGATTHRI